MGEDGCCGSGCSNVEENYDLYSVRSDSVE